MISHVTLIDNDTLTINDSVTLTLIDNDTLTLCESATMNLFNKDTLILIDTISHLSWVPFLKTGVHVNLPFDFAPPQRQNVPLQIMCPTVPPIIYHKTKSPKMPLLTFK